MSNDRCEYTTGLDLREGLLFSGIWLAWMASVWALCVLGGAQCLQ